MVIPENSQQPLEVGLGLLWNDVEIVRGGGRTMEHRRDTADDQECYVALTKRAEQALEISGRRSQDGGSPAWWRCRYRRLGPGPRECGLDEGHCNCAERDFSEEHALCVEKAALRLECKAALTCEDAERLESSQPQDEPCFGEGIAESLAC